MVLNFSSAVLEESESVSISPLNIFSVAVIALPCVAEEMQKLNDLTRIITDSMNEMAEGAIQINNAVQEVNEITQKNKHNIESLVSEVNKFKV